MPQQKISSLKTYFDELEETNGDNECKAWLSRAFDSRPELAVFVAGRREGGGTGKYIGRREADGGAGLDEMSGSGPKTQLSHMAPPRLAQSEV
jgi:hypothetical protein